MLYVVNDKRGDLVDIFFTFGRKINAYELDYFKDSPKVTYTAFDSKEIEAIKECLNLIHIRDNEPRICADTRYLNEALFQELRNKKMEETRQKIIDCTLNNDDDTYYLRDFINTFFDLDGRFQGKIH